MFNRFKKKAHSKIENSIITNESIKEFVYVDEIRLNKYFEQISPPEKTESLITKNLKTGITNLGVDINENIRTRNYTTYEKILMVEDYLKRNKQLLDGRTNKIYTFENKGPFIKETITAQRIYLPPRRLAGKGLNLWVAESEKKQKDYGHPEDPPLFLVEDYTIRERDSIPISAYSILLLLSIGYREELKRTRIGDKSLILKFNVDPIDELKKLGAVSFDKRNITVLYKVRASELSNCFGYPIYIVEN